MLDLLDDADAFVVSRAVEGLSNADLAVAVEPLVRAAAKHPDLAPKIVEMLARGQKMRVAALPHLRKFRKHENPQVRAAALAGLCTVLPNEMGDEIDAGLQDPSDKVRIAAAQVCFQTMEAQRSANGSGDAANERAQRRGNAYYGGAMTYEVSGSVVAAPQPPSSSEGIVNPLYRWPTKQHPTPKKPVESKPVAEESPAAGDQRRPGRRTRPTADPSPPTRSSRSRRSPGP